MRHKPGSGYTYPRSGLLAFSPSDEVADLDPINDLRDTLDAQASLSRDEVTPRKLGLDRWDDLKFPRV